MNHPDNAIYEMIGSLLSDGRTSRLYKSLVEQQQLALAAQGFSGYPGEKYPNLMLFYAQTAPGRTVDEVASALRKEIERLKTEPVSALELDRVKTQARAICCDRSILIWHGIFAGGLSSKHGRGKLLRN